MQVFILPLHKILTCCWYIFLSILRIHEKFSRIIFKLFLVILQEYNILFGIISVYHHNF